MSGLLAKRSGNLTASLLCEIDITSQRIWKGIRSLGYQNKLPRAEIWMDTGFDHISVNKISVNLLIHLNTIIIGSADFEIISIA